MAEGKCPRKDGKTRVMVYTDSMVHYGRLRLPLRKLNCYVYVWVPDEVLEEYYVENESWRESERDAKDWLDWIENYATPYKFEMLCVYTFWRPKKTDLEFIPIGAVVD